MSEQRTDLEAIVARLIDGKLDTDDAVLSLAMGHAPAYADLRRVVSKAVADLAELAERLPAEPDQRPLQDVLADIRGLGYDVTVSDYGGHGNVTSWRHDRNPQDDDSEWTSTSYSGDILGAAEARLEGIRALHAAKAIPPVDEVLPPIATDSVLAATGDDRVWCYAKSPGVAACGKQYEAITDNPTNVTCPECRKYVVDGEPAGETDLPDEDREEGE